MSSLVADEGGLAALLPSNRAALDVLLAGIERAASSPAPRRRSPWTSPRRSSSSTGRTCSPSENRRLRAAELVDELASWVDDYPIVSIEDALGEDD